MSLKAKFEAVIYAAEEPVTLAQLATLFADDLTPAQSEAAPHAEQAELPIEAGGDAPPSEEAVALEPSDNAPTPISARAKSDTASARVQQRLMRDAARVVVDDLIADYAAEGETTRGMEIREVAGGYRMATKPEYHDAVRGFIKSLKPALKLSLPALETLAVIAYKQPVTSPEIGEIRGVDSAGVLGGLLARKLITTAGRKQVLGRPILYKTTQEFLLRFGLKDVQELPSLEEFEKMAAEITEFDDAPASPQQAAQEYAALVEAEISELGETEEDRTTDGAASQAAVSGTPAIEVEEEQAQP